MTRRDPNSSSLINRFDLRGDGRIILYLRSGLKNPKWQVRIRIPYAREYTILSTKTSNRNDAIRFAANKYDELCLHVQSGGAIRSKTFRQVFDDWERSVTIMGPTRQGGSWTSTIERVRSYALGYFGSKKIEQISASDFQQFWLWRKGNYSKRSPSNGTLGRERTAILAVFKHALSMGHINKIPDSKPPKSEHRRRPTFTEHEWNIIVGSMDDWVEEGRRKSTWRDRFVAQQYILILANSGMRVGELRTLRWGDLRTVSTQDGNRLIADVRGKTGSREVVLQEGADAFVRRLYDLRCDELRKAALGQGQEIKPQKSGYVVCHADGTTMRSLKRSFYSLLSYASVPIKRHGVARTIYSLRHYYATQRLSHETSPFLLAKQMGTSIEMLENFYGQTITSSLAAQLTRGRRTLQVTSTDKLYPFD